MQYSTFATYKVREKISLRKRKKEKKKGGGGRERVHAIFKDGRVKVLYILHYIASHCIAFNISMKCKGR